MPYPGRESNLGSPDLKAHELDHGKSQMWRIANFSIFYVGIICVFIKFVIFQYLGR